MSELTKEYFDQQLNKVASKVDLRSTQESVEELARLTANGFEEIKRELDVRKRVEKLEKDYIRIKEALNLGR